MNYSVDLALLIDCTGSMSKAIGYAKDHALKFHSELLQAMKSRQKTIDQLRVRVVGYRDYYDNVSDALVASEFFKLPEQEDEFNQFVNKLSADGGGDEPETALEAIANAIVNSDWETSMDKTRHVIVVWTDASAHELERRDKPSGYPSDMPKTFAELNEKWGQDMKSSAKRLILFAPSSYPWSDLAEIWDNVIHYESIAGQGLEDVDFTAILNTIANSI